VAGDAGAAESRGATGSWTRRRHLALATFWFGLYFLYQPVGTSLVPAQIDRIVPHDREAYALGVALGIGAFAAMAVAPLVGVWSDRISTRFGRRRPFIVVGVAGTVLSLLLLGAAPTFPVLVIGYTLVQLFSNAAGAAYAGVIPDIVPAVQIGVASGWLAVMVLVGSAGGLIANTVLAAASRTLLTYTVIAIVLAVCMVPTLMAARGEGASPPPPRDTRPFGDRARDFFAPLRRGDFAWVVWTRMVNNAGISVVTPFTFLFFKDVVGVGKPDVFNPAWYLVVLLFAGPMGYLGGRLSDRHGRKVFVYWSGALQAVVAFVFIVLYPKLVPVVLALGAVYGVGYGMYNSVDWALAVDTLPDRRASAKDMGLFHIALTLPGQVMPALGGLVLGLVNGAHGNQGFRVVFGSAAVFFALSTVLVRRVRSVR
jgi:MFS family permease